MDKEFKSTPPTLNYVGSAYYILKIETKLLFKLTKDMHNTGSGFYYKSYYFLTINIMPQIEHKGSFLVAELIFYTNNDSIKSFKDLTLVGVFIYEVKFQEIEENDFPINIEIINKSKLQLPIIVGLTNTNKVEFLPNIFVNKLQRLTYEKHNSITKLKIKEKYFVGYNFKDLIENILSQSTISFNVKEPLILEPKLLNH